MDEEKMSVESSYIYRNNPGFIDTIAVYVGPEKTSLNYVHLYVNQQINDTRPLNEVVQLVKEYASNMFRGIEVNVSTFTISECSPAFSKRLGNIGDTYVEYLRVPAEDARKVVDLLYQFNEISIDNRADIEFALRKLEKCAEQSKKINDDAELTLAQKEIIKELVSPFIEGIKEEVSDVEAAKSYVRSATHHVKWTSSFQNITKQHMRFHLPSCYGGKSDGFYDCLFALARIGSMRAELETTFEKTGPSLPSERQLKDVILETMDEVYNTAAIPPGALENEALTQKKRVQISFLRTFYRAMIFLMRKFIECLRMN